MIRGPIGKMSLKTGSRIGHYEIVSAIGAGGMGQVYRARDPKLGRDVAIKVLPPTFAGDPDRLMRFTREAQTLAALNHSNIAQIYGVEANALVMELVDGEDLSAHIARGPIAVAEALPIARQIADALEAAHERGIIHRDLKPANIKIRSDGTVKVLDFGLAKAMSPEGASSEANLSNSPTMTSPATELGMILGTAAYMSPEQARGKAVDRRTDVWAFGVVLLEMLSGRRVFAGAEVSDVLASILKDAPDFARLPPDTPAAIRRLLRRCLEKDRAARLDSMGVARLEIAEALAEERDGGTRATAVTSTRSGHRRSIAMPIAAAIGAAVITAVAMWPRPVPAMPSSRFTLTPVGSELGVNINQPDLAISPDGRRIVYGSALTATSTIVVRSLDGFGDTTLTGLGHQPRSPFFSPDGKWIGYYTTNIGGYDGRLMKVPVDGSGVPAEITPVAGNLRGASWSEDGTIVFATAALDTGLFRVAATGGSVEPLTVPDGTAGEADHLWPHVLPDGKHVLFVISRHTPDIAGGRWDVAALDVSTKKWRVLRADASYPLYVATGHLLFSSNTGLSALRFDPVTITVHGDSQVLAADVLFKASTGAADVGVSSTGTLVYVAGGSDDMKTLVWTDRQGKVTTIPAPARAYLNGRLSPDGDRVAMVLNERGMSGIWIYDFARTTLMRLTPDGFPGYGPVWSESGRDLFFAGLPASGVGLFTMAASGTGKPALVATATDGRYEPFSIRRGSPEILVEFLRGTGVRTTFLMNPGPPASPRPLGLGVNDAQPSLSPDGRWLAYVSEESGRFQVYLRPFPDLAADRIAISTQGGYSPRWSKTGELFFQGVDGAVWVTRVGDDRRRVGQPIRLPPPPATVRLVSNFDVSPDGQRVLGLASQERTGATSELRVVTNWFDELRKKFGER